MEDTKVNVEESKDNKNIQISNWEEYENFYEAHSLQLYGMNFPKELGEKLFYKLKHEIFDSSRFFEILDNQEEERFILNAKMAIKKDLEVFLVDHCWTFKLRQFNYFCEKFPNVIDRIYKMLKYGHVKRDIASQGTAASIQFEVNPEYADLDNKEISNLNEIDLDEKVKALSLENNKIKDLDQIFEFLTTKEKSIRAIWLEGNPFEEQSEGYESLLSDMFDGLEIINRKFTKNSTKWSIDFITQKRGKQLEHLERYNSLYANTNKIIDLSGRDPLRIKDLSIFSEVGGSCMILDIRDNNYDFNFEDKEFIFAFLAFIKYFAALEQIIVDENDYYEAEIPSQSFIHFIRTNKHYELLLEHCPNLKLINDYPLAKVISSDFLKYHKESRVIKYIWKISQTYRLMTSEKYDEDATWYINDEIGSAINHSDEPNMAMFPFIFSPSNTFKDDMITYSVLWPINDIKREEEIFRDFLTNISEAKQRSARLTCWFNTPKEYFLTKFTNKIIALAVKTDLFNDVIKNYQENLNLLSEATSNAEEFEKIYQKTFNFETLLNKEDETLIQATQIKVLESITQLDQNSENKSERIDRYFVDNFLNNKIKIKVFSDLAYVRENVTLECFEITENIEEADILWLNIDYFKLAENVGIHLKPRRFINQFPFENVITMKSHLTDLVQNNAGLNSFLGLSYNMETELAEIIGNHLYNAENNLDNSWILKPINMTRSMDMIVTNNIDEIIRSVETGPKICQKYMDRPFLLNNKKFDLRFIIIVKRLAPLELYIYSKMFWVRSGNKDFTMDSSTFTDYEVHFTVMNYNTFGMQTIYDKQFVEYLESKNVKWETIYNQIKDSMRSVFLMAGKDCPQMNDPYSRAIYGLDVMIDADLQPKILELNYSPDCTRACKFIPEFYNDIFSTLFLEAPSGVEKIN